MKAPRTIEEGKRATPVRKRLVRERNFQRNGGEYRDDVTGERGVLPEQGRAGVTPREDEIHVDEIKPVSKGGTNAYPNLNVRLRKYNLGKSNEYPYGG